MVCLVGRDAYERCELTQNTDLRVFCRRPRDFRVVTYFRTASICAFVLQAKLMHLLPTQLIALQTFNGISEADAALICESLGTRHFASGDAILDEGKSVQALWMILEGECQVSRVTEAGTSQVLADLKAGDVFGEMSFVRDAPHSASIVATSDVIVCMYDREDFLELARVRPEAALQIQSNIAAVLAERLRRMDAWVCEIMDRPEESEHRDEWQDFRAAVYTNWDF